MSSFFEWCQNEYTNIIMEQNVSKMIFDIDNPRVLCYHQSVFSMEGVCHEKVSC